MATRNAWRSSASAISAALQGNILQLRVGFANEIHKRYHAGLDVTCPDQTHVVVQGCDKQQVGQFAAEVRAVRKPEPYKGKGIRYEGEHVKIKPGKVSVVIEIAPPVRYAGSGPTSPASRLRKSPSLWRLRAR